MNFDVLSLGPFQETATPGDPFSIKDHWSLAARHRPASSNLDDSSLVARFAAEARECGLRVMIDCVLTHTAADGDLRARHPDWFLSEPTGQEEGWGRTEAARIDWNPGSRDAIREYFLGVIRHYAALGIEGFRCPAASMVPADVWAELIAEAKAAVPACFFCADALGRPEAELRQITGAGFDFIFNSVRWWDARSPWFVSQEALLQSIGSTIGFPENERTGHFWDDAEEDLPVRMAAYKARYLIAALFSTGILMPAGYERMMDWPRDPESQAALENGAATGDLTRFIATANALKATIPALSGGPPRALARPYDAVQGFARTSSTGDDLVFIVINTDGVNSYRIDLDWLLAPLDKYVDLEDVTPDASPLSLDRPDIVLRPGEIRIFRTHPGTGAFEAEPERDAGAASSPPSRVIIEAAQPAVDGGAFPAKAVIGDAVQITADIYRDGHDRLAAAIRFREGEGSPWRHVAMRHEENDRWSGTITPTAQGRCTYVIEAWTDRFSSWRADTVKKRAAGQAIGSDLLEGRELLAEAVGRASRAGRERLTRRLEALSTRFDRLRNHEATSEEASDLLLSHFVSHAVGAIPDRDDLQSSARALDLVVDRKAARFSAWYEIFPRSQGNHADRSSSFADCERRLPEIRELGFDVLYLVPIHPIGLSNRKGRNNALTAAPGDPGSPYAIGSAAGGHMAVDPELGGLEGFRRFRRAAEAHGMELALDLAIQCAPDHPWVTEHPNWFRRRPDGTIKFAENPPKKYEDIVNLDFDGGEWRAVWAALLEVVQFWIGEGVKIFRVDNPHTKPVAFWQWLIAEVKRDHPEVIFLAEAFTRPKMMRRLAKIGFAQSYSYFTWRNTKAELTEYLVELTTGESRDYMQPNFFANTPDILPFFLQTGGRAGFLIRLVLAATLSPAYGIYSGFELCEAAALPGREEYADSEKYQFKVRDWDAPGNLKDEIRRLNHLRRNSPALQEFVNLRFDEASHPNVLFYGKKSPFGGDHVFVAVNLDPAVPASAWLNFPLEMMELGEDGSFETVELFSGERRHWQGRHHEVYLDPATQPAMVLKLVGKGSASW